MEEKKRRWKVRYIVAAAVAATAIMTIGIVTLAVSLTRPVVTASDAFMTALKDGEYQSAYAMGTPDLQRDLGSAQRLGSMFVERPARWSWRSRSIRNGAGRVSGNVFYASGHEGHVVIFLLPEGEDWKIASFRMNRQ